jgi:hypothetical protein
MKPNEEQDSELHNFKLYDHSWEYYHVRCWTLYSGAMKLKCSNLLTNIFMFYKNLPQFTYPLAYILFLPSEIESGK